MAVVDKNKVNMTHQESNEIFDQVDKALIENGFTPKEGYDKRYTFKNDYMAFNCPHMCSSLRLFQITESNGRRLAVDVRTSFARSLEDNRVLATDFVNRVIQKVNEGNNSESSTSVPQ